MPLLPLEYLGIGGGGGGLRWKKLARGVHESATLLNRTFFTKSSILRPRLGVFLQIKGGHFASATGQITILFYFSACLQAGRP